MLNDSSKMRELHSSQPSVTSAPVLSPDARRSSSAQNNSTPAKPQTPLVGKDETKLLPSALRKDSSAGKSSERRSVSFSGRKDVIPDSGPKARSTSRSSSAKEPNSTPTTHGKPTNSGGMVFPPGVSVESIIQENEQKRERWNQEKQEYEKKIQEAKSNNENPKYVRILEDLDSTLDWIIKHDGKGGDKIQQKIARDTQKMAKQRKELEQFEPRMNRSNKQSNKQPNKSNGTPKPAEKGTTKSVEKPDSSPSDSARETQTKASARRQNPQKQTKRSPPSDESPSKEPGNAKGDGEPALTNGHAPAHKEGSDQDPEPAQPQESSPAEKEQNVQASMAKEDSQTEPENTVDIDESTQPQPQPPEPQAQAQPEPQLESQPEPGQPKEPSKERSKEPEQTQVQPQEKPEEQPEEQPEPSQPEELSQAEEHSDVSKPAELQNGSLVERPKELSSTPRVEPKPAPSQEQGKESSSEEETDSESESESGSESASSSEDDEKRPNSTNSARNSATKSPASSQHKFPLSQPELQSGARFSSPLQRSQTPSQSQPQPQTQPFRAINHNSRNIRASLSGLRSAMHKQRDEHDARVKQARQASRQPKKDIFDPPSDSDESESDSDSDSDSDSNSSANEGDIQSSGTVGMLRKAIPAVRKA